jgi:hypothetical protein
MSNGLRAVAHNRRAAIIAKRNHPDGRIVLNDGSVAYVNPSDFHLVSNYVWHNHKGYARTRSPGSQMFFMHTLIIGVEDGKVTDHKDGDKLNNRRENLRFATIQGNVTNSRIKPNKSSGYRGVSKCHRRFKAIICSHGNTVYLGRFATAEEAARAYDAKARELHGDFATLNFPEAA